jgi:uncharacterized protein YggL (DUF469 family)
VSASCPILGFRVVLELGPRPSVDQDLVDAWIEFLAGRGLHCTGGGGAERMDFVVASDASQATESDRVAARAWLESRADLLRWRVGELVDLDQEA